MSFKPHAITDFVHFKEDEIAPTATVIGNSLITHAADFPLLPVAGAAVILLIKPYTDVLGKPDYAGKAADLEAARTPLEAALKTDGIFVNQLANGNAVLLAKSGYPLAKPHEPIGPLAKGTLHANSTANPGELSFKIDGVKHASGFLILYTLSSNPETDPRKWSWAWSKTTTGLLTGLNSSAKYKLCCVGLGTDPSLAFSDIIERTTQ